MITKCVVELLGRKGNVVHAKWHRHKSVKLLGVTLDNKLNFDTHISNFCKKAAAQLNVLKRLRSFIGFEQKKVLVQSFV